MIIQPRGTNVSASSRRRLPRRKGHVVVTGCPHQCHLQLAADINQRDRRPIAPDAGATVHSLLRKLKLTPTENFLSRVCSEAARVGGARSIPRILR